MKGNKGSKTNFEQAASGLQTLASLQTGQVCGMRWLDAQTSDARGQQLVEVFQAQCSTGDTGRQCKYVCTDDGAKDESMVLDASRKGGLQRAPTVGDDMWHSRKRISSGALRRRLFFI
ncbi:MAG: hypothetical protein MUE72_04955 [Chitinophagaceae bacterium]|nr:hypothetical protein [Chitinophagaceae bacterium]